MSRTVFHGGKVFDGTMAPLADGDVVIEEGRIVEVGPGLDGDESVDCAGKALLPGLFDAHVHLTGTYEDDELTVQRLARHAKMSARTFNRRFREETGESPGAWIRSRRVDRARELLESRDLPIDEVARLSGLGTGGNLRHHLRRGVGMSPSSYRKVYQGA